KQLVDANKALLSLLDRTREELERLHWRDLVAPQFVPTLQEALDTLGPEGALAPMEAAYVRRDGSLVPVLLGGTVSGGTAVFFSVDIRDRKYAEQSQRFIAEAGAVLASSLDYQSTLEQVAKLSVPAYADWCFVDVAESDTTMRRLVVTASDPARADVSARMPRTFERDPAQDASRKSEMYQNVSEAELKARADHTPEISSLQGLGICSFMVIPMVARGRFIGSVTFASSRWNYDVSNLGCAEELGRRAALAIDNARLYRDAQDAARAREDFLSIAAHELKTPLSSLKLQAQGLIRTYEGMCETPEDTRLLSSMRAIKRQVDRQNKLVDTLLDVSKISAGRLSFEFEAFDLAPLVAEVAARIDQDFARSGSKFVLQCPPSLEVTWDRIRADQLLTNLLSNALKYGRGKPVECVILERDDRVQIEVRDQGIGISAKDRARIFGRFERAVSERNYGGFGLGLWITNRIIEAMGGSISLESQVDEGSTFVVDLPRQVLTAT
ncbi:MAG: ATP-binding protein, partial [Myxococcaceae bacterium]